ncbi:MAG: hypothetical protein ABIC82_02480 [bacterium]
MQKKSQKILSAFLILLTLGVFGFVCLRPASATAPSTIWESITDKDEGGLKEIGSTVFGDGTPKNTVPEIIARVVKYLLTFLGVIFIVLIVYAGFIYMTAMGESDKISSAKNIIISASIGLAIILASYSFTYFILQAFTNATGTN